jgi:hypothetical protein
MVSVDDMQTAAFFAAERLNRRSIYLLGRLES